MKTTIKLLIGLLILVTGIMSFTNYQLSKKYANIDTEDRFYEYEQIIDLNFNKININGGNELQVVIESGDKNALFIRNRHADKINYENKNGILNVNFHNDATSIDFDTREEDYFRQSPSVYITCTDLTELTGKNGNIALKSELNESMHLTCNGNTKLNLNILKIYDGSLTVTASDNSYINVIDNSENGTISYADFNMKDSTFLKMKTLKTDSIRIQLSPESEINCGSSIINKLK